MEERSDFRHEPRRALAIPREPLKNYLTRPGGVEFAKKMLIYYV